MRRVRNSTVEGSPTTKGMRRYTEEFTFDSDNSPEMIEGLKGPSVVARVFLDYNDGELAQVRITSDVKALGIMINDSYEYSCEIEN